jgi:carbon monoxide dehydrogenase subunit G
LISIAEEISVPSSPDEVWAVVSDPSAVVSCIQGAELGAVHENGSFDGTLIVKFGALRVRFAALVSLELAETDRAGRLSARGRDGQGATRFNGGATFRVAQATDPGHSLVTMAGEVNLNGKLASLIESGAGAVVSRMTKEFSAQLIERCSAPAGSVIPEAGRAAVSASPPAAGKASTAASPARGAGRLLSRWRAWWTRLRHGRRTGPPGPGAPAQSPPVEEAASGNAKAQ